MKIITLDFETFFSDEYTLSKLTTEGYIRDERFEALGVSIKFGADLPAKWFGPDEIEDVFDEIDWANTAVLAHHAQFDGLILSHIYDRKPKFWFDTLSMARLLLGNHLSVGLDALAKHFGLAAKTVPYNLFKGKHWEELTPAVQQMVGSGACHDVELTWQIFNILAKDFPREEYDVIDATVRMFTEPALRCDIDMLAALWEAEDKRKKDRLAALNTTEAELQSAEKFATLLRAAGIEPETKQGKNDAIYAFAKTDDFMRGLLEHDNDTIRALAEARLGVKSTLLQTRAETLGWMARRGPCPVYLRYAGAHTTRWSGGDGANWQNFKRGSDIRRAIIAPESFLLAPIDLSQIEMRLLNYLAGQEDVIERLRNGEDPYLQIASEVYGFQVTKEHPKERGTGKQLELSCGYQAGAATIQNTAKLGIYGPPVIIDLQTAKQWRDVYRNSHPQVVEYWKTAGRMISRIGGGDPLQWGPMLIKDKKIYGPGGTMLHYDTLEYYKPSPDEDVKAFERDGFWRYRTRNGWTKLYSGKLVENVVQWLARIVMSQAMLRIRARGYRILTTTHDELLVAIPKDGREQAHLQFCIDEMKRTPDWLPGIPLDCEGAVSERYAK